MNQAIYIFENGAVVRLDKVIAARTTLGTVDICFDWHNYAIPCKDYEKQQFLTALREFLTGEYHGP
jgi:hypothetical protein